MTDAELQGITAQALNMAKRDLARGGFNFLLAAQYAGEQLHRMDKIEAMIIEKLGENWLNSGGAKDVGMNLIALAVAMSPPEAVVWATGVNLFKSTPKLAQLPPEEQEKILNAGHARHHKAVEEGLLTVVDGLVAVGQTAARVCNYVLELGSQKPDVRFWDQADFGGRLKMYGRDPLSILGELNALRRRGSQ